jgi:hypothetical protein
MNYPNPFNPMTTITFSLPSTAFVSLRVFDIMGREKAVLVAEELTAGTYASHWDASGVATGVYFYRLQARHTDGGRAGLFTESRKLILFR